MEPENAQKRKEAINDANVELIANINEIVADRVSKNVRDVKTFLSNPEFITEKGDQKTNIINVYEKKTYNIPDSRQEEFFILLEAIRLENRTMHYSERQETEEYGHTGIMIDIDRYQKSKDRQITREMLGTFTGHLARLLASTLDFSPLENPNGRFDYHMFVIMKAQPDLVKGSNPPVYKDGFHLLIPELQVTRGYKKYLLKLMQDKRTMASFFRGVDDGVEPPEKALDMMSASVPVYFFGGAKPGKIAYPLTHAFLIQNTQMDDLIDKISLDVADLIRGKNGDKPVNMVYELSLHSMMNTIGGHPTWLKKNVVNYKPELETHIQLVAEKTAGGLIAEDEIDESDKNVNMLTIVDPNAKYVQQLLSILDLSYVDEYNKWFKVICAIAHTSPRYKDLAIWFSQRKPDQWSPAALDKVWSDALKSTTVKAPVTLRSLVWWAKESSPEKFRDIEQANWDRVLTTLAVSNEGRVEHAIAAKVLWYMIRDKFVVDVDKRDLKVKKDYIWFEFVVEGQQMEKGELWKWRQESSPDNLHLYITEKLPSVYKNVTQYIRDKREACDDENEAKFWAGVDKTFKIYTSKLHNDGFQEGIIKQARYRFRQRGFLRELDTQWDLLGVGNGILRIGAVPELITGYHSHKVSKYTPVDYVPYDPESPYVKVLLQAFRDIFIEPDVFEYMMFHAATGLDGKESACILLFIVGGGQNGKTFIAKLKHRVLGDQYAASGKSALLVSPMERGDGANSAQMQLKGKRDFYFDEFQACEQLNVARVKSIVNPGYQSGRDLNKTQENFISTCNPLALSNFELKIDTTDHGTWRRLKQYKAKVKFCPNPDPNNPYEKKVDRRFMDEYTSDPNYLSAMLSIMVHYYSRLVVEYGGDITRVPCPTIDYETEIYRNRQDSLNRFLTTMLVVSPSAPDMGLSMLADRYIAWHQATLKIPVRGTQHDVMSQLENSKIEKMIVKIHGNQFVSGCRLKEYLEESLRDGETSLLDSIPAPTPEAIKAIVAEFDKPEVINVENELVGRNFTVHTQKTTAHTDAPLTEEDINRLLTSEVI
jgi:phage/plasmid-associated DNA primase